MRRQKINKASSNTCKTLVCVLENPTNILNIGSVIRTVNCLGVSKLYVVDKYDVLDAHWNDMKSNSILKSTSSGSIKWTYIKKFSTTSDCFVHLVKNGYKSIATSPHDNKLCMDLLDGTYTDKKLAIWFGNEINGLSVEAIEKVDRCIKIPMYGITESLNLAVCNGIVLHEVVKQRRHYTTVKS